VDWQGVYSHTEEPDDSALTSNYNGQTFDNGARTVDFDGESFGGYAATVRLNRVTRRLFSVLRASAWSPTFRADNGFVTRNSASEVAFENYRDFRWESGLVHRFNIGVTTGRVWNWEGQRKDEWVRPGMVLQFTGRYSVDIGHLWSRERFREINFDRIHETFIRLIGEGSNVFRWGVGWGIQRNHIARNLATPTEGNGHTLSTSAAIFPVERLVIRPLYYRESLDRSDNGQPIFRAAVFRTRFNYQFTRELFLRLVVQYYKEETYAQSDPTQIEQYESLSLEPLLTYRVNPFTLFYIGSTHQ